MGYPETLLGRYTADYRESRAGKRAHNKGKPFGLAVATSNCQGAYWLEEGV